MQTIYRTMDPRDLYRMELPKEGVVEVWRDSLSDRARTIRISISWLGPNRPYYDQWQHTHGITQDGIRVDIEVDSVCEVFPWDICTVNAVLSEILSDHPEWKVREIDDEGETWLATDRGWIDEELQVHLEKI